EAVVDVGGLARRVVGADRGRHEQVGGRAAEEVRAARVAVAGAAVALVELRREMQPVPGEAAVGDARLVAGVVVGELAAPLPLPRAVPDGGEARRTEAVVG